MRYKLSIEMVFLMKWEAKESYPYSEILPLVLACVYEYFRGYVQTIVK